MNERPFLCFYKNMMIEIHATSSYAAQTKAAKQLKVPEKKQYLIVVTCCVPITSIGERESSPRSA